MADGWGGGGDRSHACGVWRDACRGDSGSGCGRRLGVMESGVCRHGMNAFVCGMTAPQSDCFRLKGDMGI